MIQEKFQGWGIKIFVALVAMFVAGWIIVSASDAKHITACVTKLGVIHIVGDGYSRSECRKNETFLSWNIGGEKGDSGADGRDGVDGKDGIELHLFDANGQDLGILLDAARSTDMTYLTYLHDIGVLVASYQDPSRMFAGLNLPEKSVQFSESDCTGEAVTTGNLAPQLLYRDDAGDFGLGFIVSSLEPPALRTIKSRRENNGNCFSFGSQTTLTNTFIQVVLPFSEPLVWPLEVKKLP